MPSNTKTIRVIAGNSSDWPDARLCLQDAARLLREPLHILLEDAINDLAFLRRLAPANLRERLEQALEHGWAVVDHAGGVNGIGRLVTKFNAQDTSTRIKKMRYWIMFDRDSDSRDRAKPDPKTERLHHLLNQQPADALCIKHHRLERRAIENYIPNAALERWANAAKGPVIDQRHKMRKALELLRQNNHSASCQYNMKGGLHSDLGEKYGPLSEQLNAQRNDLRGNLHKLASILLDDHCDPIFRGRAALDRAALAFGFGSNIAAIYTDDTHDDFDQSFQDEYARGQHSMTREQIIEQILQSL